MSKSLSAAALFFLLLCPVIAQTETPDAVVKTYIAATQASDWAKASTFMHPEALDSLKRTFAEVLKLDKTNEAGKELFGLKTNAEFEQLSGAQVFERMMLLLTSSVPQMKELLSQTQTTILGQVPENTDLIHLVCRTQINVQGSVISKVEVMSLKQSGSTWRLLLSGEMEGAISSLAEAIEAEAAAAAEKAPAKTPAPKKPVRKR